MEKSLQMSLGNIKAYAAENDSLKDRCRVFKFTVEQLNTYNDSILDRLIEVQHELGIKSRNLKNLQYIESKATRTDTVVFNDTIFRTPAIDMDTLIGDEWYYARLKMKYPNVVCINPTFRSEKYIITSKRKETVNPPKKLFFLRWFQKKQWVMEVDIKEKNPYITNTKSKFIEVIKK